MRIVFEVPSSKSRLFALRFNYVWYYDLYADRIKQLSGIGNYKTVGIFFEILQNAFVKTA